MKKKQFSTTYSYHDRKTKAQYVFDKYKPLLQGKLLDVGADQCYLKKHLPPTAHYTGIGRDTGVVCQVNLEQKYLPFQDRSFDLILCLDVLEHLDHIHQAFAELCRVSANYIIISLPNALAVIWYRILGKPYFPGQLTKFYGLPKEPPADRHKWFFSYTEALEFITHNARKHGFEVVETDAEKSMFSEEIFEKTLSLKGIINQDLDLRNLYWGTLWAVLKQA